MDDMALDMDKETVRLLGHRFVDRVVSELSDPSRRPPRPPAQSDEMLALFDGPLPHEGTDPDEFLSVIEEHFIPATANLLHPRWMAYVLAGSLPLAGLKGGLISSLNLAYIDPIIMRVAKTITRWLGEMLRFGPDAAGYITTGGTWANLVGLAVARVRRAGWDVRNEGLTGTQH